MKKVLENVELAFSDRFRSSAERERMEQQVRGLIAARFVKEEDFDQVVNKSAGR